ncbi:ribosomal protein S5 domain 2-type protein [Leptodontidium sp. 2 PMI_412]|nr:ribosomal protein S5 domain 2-type protein [Leptodontidium sp. 2 PMI_412]
MNEDLENEVEAINSIYGEESLVVASDDNIYILRLPQHDTSLRLRFPKDYPAAPPAILGTESSGEHTRKGDAAHIVAVFRDVLGRLYQPGEVCLFDVIEEVNSAVPSATDLQVEDQDGEQVAISHDSTSGPTPQAESDATDIQQVPWILSEAVVELKSVFVARSAQVSSPDQAKLYLQLLLDADKKVRSATHNITAWRIKGENGVTYQDCDDDGETAAGGRVLHLMQLMDIWNVMVVVTRWYGGHQLGPKRFSIINTVARDAFVRGGFVQEDSSAAKKKGKR